VLTGPPPDHCARPFRFERDTFAFANELIWQYRFDPVTKAMSVSRNHPPPTYSHRCFMVVKSARQFLYHARFEPGLPIAEPEVYRRLIRQILSRNPRRASAAPERIMIPGYDGLRALSQAHEPLLKAECGAPWQSYFLRSHWRMVFPIWKRHQERIAHQLRQGMSQGSVPTVHIFRFPRITINHGLMLFGMVESERDIQFEAYDPNLPAHSAKLIYDRARRSFSFPSTCYWPGGELRVIEIFCGGLY
jgi:hypothetical protein